MKGIVYKAICLINGKIYVGQTVRSLSQRIKEHKIGKVGVFTKAIKKYGIENFVFEVIDRADNRIDLNSRESMWILKLNTVLPNGYNITMGGEGCNGCIRSEETRHKMSIARKNAPEETHKKLSIAATGRVHTQESKDKMRTSHTGKVLTLEHCSKISAAHMGKPKSLETRERLSKSHMGKRLTPEHCEKIRVLKNNLSEETRRRMSESAKNRVEMSEESRKKISIANTGKIRSPETRRKMSEARITREVLKVWSAAM